MRVSINTALSLALHLHALDVVPADQLGRQGPIVVADQHDPMGMAVDEVADLLDLALGHEAAAVHEDDVRRERLDFVQHVAGNDHAVAAFAQAADHGRSGRGGLRGPCRVNGSSRNSTRGSWTRAWASLIRCRMPFE